MLCVTGSERTTEELARRLARMEGQADRLAEVRLDAIEAPLDDALSLLKRYAERVVVCLRPTRQGGEYRGDEATRLGLLERAASAGVFCVDVEADCNDEALCRLKMSTKGELMLSWHHFEPCPSLDALRAMVGRMDREPATMVKLAVAVEDAAELEPLLGLQVRRPKVLLGMGLAGQLSRARYPQFGSRWTYVAASRDQTTAPGQFSLAEAEDLGMPASSGCPFLALLGGSSSRFSPGPRVYNSLFRLKGLPWSYLLALSERRPAQTLALLERLGALGASVTMPHKAAVLDVVVPDQLAVQACAVNTVRFDNDAWQGANTDIIGVGAPLRAALEVCAPQPSTALVLGTGGAGRAAVIACRQLGLDVAMSARTPGGAPRGVPCIAWEQRCGSRASVLINATPVTGPHESPWPDSEALHAAIVFDLAVGGPGESALLRRARTSGAATIAPWDMWVAQGAAQMRWLTGEPFDVDELRRALHDV